MDPDQTPDDLQESRGPFFMYACYNASPDWDLNQHFWRLPVDPPLPQVYGDAFIFKVKERPFDKFGKVRYDNLNEETIQSAFNGNGMGSDECLTWLAKQERNWRDLSRLYT